MVNILLAMSPLIHLVQKNTVRQRFRDKLATCCYIGGTGPYIPARLLPCWKHIRQGLQGCQGNLRNFTLVFSPFHSLILDDPVSSLICPCSHRSSYRFACHSPRVQASGSHYPNATRVCIPLAPAFPCQDLRLLQDGWTNGASRCSRQGMSLEIWWTGFAI